MFVSTEEKGSKIRSENKENCFGAKMKNNREGQFIDPSVCYKSNVMLLCFVVTIYFTLLKKTSSVMNK